MNITDIKLEGMRYKIYVSMLLLFSMMWAGTSDLLAQENFDIEISRSMVETERKAIISQIMSLNENEASIFWPVYDQYRMDMRKVNDRFINLMEEYAEYYLTLDDRKADDLMKEYFSVEMDEIRVKRIYRKRFEKVLTPKQVARFFQADNKIDLVIKNEVSDVVPLIE